MVCKDGKETLFELRGHPYFGKSNCPVDRLRMLSLIDVYTETGDEYDEPGTPDSSGSNGGFDGGGVMGTTRAQRRTFQAGINGEMGMDDDDERSCKAFWVMGRKWQGQGDGGAKMLDSFLELKMENERLRQELRVSLCGGILLIGFSVDFWLSTRRICKLDHSFPVSLSLPRFSDRIRTHRVCTPQALQSANTARSRNHPRVTRWIR